MASREVLEKLGKFEMDGLMVKDTVEYEYLGKTLDQLENIKDCLKNYGIEVSDLANVCLFYKMYNKEADKLEKLEKIERAIHILKEVL